MNSPSVFSTTHKFNRYVYKDCEILFDMYSSADELPVQGDYKLVDLKGLLKKNHIEEIKVIDIDSVYVEQSLRCKGVGSECLKRFCKEFNDSLIILTAGLHKREADLIGEDNMDDYAYEVLDRIIKFYTSNNFCNVNDLIGFYDGMATMVYRNNYCLNLFSRLNISV